MTGTSRPGPEPDPDERLVLFGEGRGRPRSVQCRWSPRETVEVRLIVTVKVGCE